MKISKNTIGLIALYFVSMVSSCTKFLDVESPITNINSENVYESDETAAAVMTGIYAEMSANAIAYGGLNSLSFLPGLISDELSLYDVGNRELAACYSNSLTPTTAIIDYWNKIYPIIYTTNSVIEGVQNSKGLSNPVKQQLTGEAKFIRAFCYFYLANIYGDVPIASSTDYKKNSVLSRSATVEVYKFILNDLKQAEVLLSEEYLNGSLVASTSERVRPNKWAAVAMLARVYLYMKDYSNAEKYATLVIENKKLFNLVNLGDVFLKNSGESIWQLQGVGNDYSANTPEGRLFILPETGPATDNPVYLSDRLLNSFEINDLRFENWIGNSFANGKPYPYAFKYKIGSILTATNEYSMVLRLSEQYLIRAEARIFQGNVSSGIDDVNVIRARATDESKPDNERLRRIPLNISKDDAIQHLVHERRVELFTEWGHRWFDLKRWNLADEVISDIEGKSWQPTDKLFPIPQGDIDRNPMLKSAQNPGYR